MTNVLRQRIIVGTGLMAVALAALVLGGLSLWLVAAAAAGGMLIEWSRLFAARPARLALALAGLALVVVLALPTAWGPTRDTVAALAGAALVIAAVGANGALATGLFYVGLPMLALLYLRGMPQGVALAGWTLAVVWATDIAAYFAGRALGGPKLAPAVSPSKTWAGLAGGVAAAGLVGAGLASASGLSAPFLWLGAPLAVLAQAGDLFESGLKRRARVKDSGATLGAHGGLLDRLDGAVPVLVVVAALVANGTLVP